LIREEGAIPRRRDDTALEYSTGDVMSRKAADLKDAGPRYLL
jgi:hypothetical protein